MHIRLFSRQARIGRQERGQRFSYILAMRKGGSSQLRPRLGTILRRCALLSLEPLRHRYDSIFDSNAWLTTFTPLPWFSLRSRIGISQHFGGPSHLGV